MLSNTSAPLRKLAVAFVLVGTSMTASAQFLKCEKLTSDQQTQADFCSAHISCAIAVKLLDTCTNVTNFISRFFSDSKKSQAELAAQPEEPYRAPQSTAPPVSAEQYERNNRRRIAAMESRDRELTSELRNLNCGQEKSFDSARCIEIGNEALALQRQARSFDSTEVRLNSAALVSKDSSNFLVFNVAPSSNAPLPSRPRTEAADFITQALASARIEALRIQENIRRQQAVREEIARAAALEQQHVERDALRVSSQTINSAATQSVASSTRATGKQASLIKLKCFPDDAALAELERLSTFVPRERPGSVRGHYESLDYILSIESPKQNPAYMDRTLKNLKGNLGYYQPLPSQDDQAEAARKRFELLKTNMDLKMAGCYFENANLLNTAVAPTVLGNCARRAEVAEAEFNRRFSMIPKDNRIAQLGMLYSISKTVSDIWLPCNPANAKSYKDTADNTLRTCSAIATTPSVCTPHINW